MVASLATISTAALANICRRYHIRKLSLFGSAAGRDFAQDSDIDLLVDFDPRHIPDFFTLDDIARELSKLFDQRPVDLVTERALAPAIRQQVLDEARILYAKG